MTDDDAQTPSEPDPARSAAPRLDRAPGERFRAGTPGAGPAPATGGSPDAAPTAGGTGRAILAGAGVAAAGAILYAALGEIDLGPGLLAVAAFIGWMVALAVVWGAGVARPIPRQRLVAGLLGAGSIVAGLLLATAWARMEGGVLGPLDYTAERYGPIAYLEVLLAGLVATVRAR